MSIHHICIIDDHEIIRSGLSKVLENTKQYKVVYTFDSTEALLNHPITQTIDLIIQDLSLANGCDLSQLDLLKHKCPKAPILIYTMHAESLYALPCLKYNISGYLTKDKPITDLLTAVSSICKGNRYFSQECQQLLTDYYLKGTDTQSTSSLSQREKEVYLLIGQGLSPTDISKRLFINIKTVSTYRRRILDKLKLSSSHQIIHHYLNNQ